jgi:hypothetical protein
MSDLWFALTLRIHDRELMDPLTPLTPKSLGAAEKRLLRQERWGGRLKRSARWVAIAVVALLCISIAIGYIRSHASSIGHTFGVGSAAWEEGNTYGQKVVVDASEQESLTVLLACHGTYPQAYELWIHDGLPGAPKKFGPGDAHRWILQFNEGCVAGAREQWSAYANQ